MVYLTASDCSINGSPSTGLGPVIGKRSSVKWAIISDRRGTKAHYCNRSATTVNITRISVYKYIVSVDSNVGGVSDETVKYGREFCGTSIQEWLLWQSLEAIVQVNHRPVYSSERALQNNKAATVKKKILRRKKNWSRVPDGRLTPRLTVGRKVTLTFWLDSKVFWRWCITFRINGFLGFVHLQEFLILENTMFRKMVSFPLSG
jgi:hypothetical protein